MSWKSPCSYIIFWIPKAATGDVNVLYNYIVWNDLSTTSELIFTESVVKMDLSLKCQWRPWWNIPLEKEIQGYGKYKQNIISVLVMWKENLYWCVYKIGASQIFKVVFVLSSFFSVDNFSITLHAVLQQCHLTGWLFHPVFINSVLQDALIVCLCSDPNLVSWLQTCAAASVWVDPVIELQIMLD